MQLCPGSVPQIAARGLRNGPIPNPLWARRVALSGAGTISAGLGMWGGVQPGLYRVDAGPRLSMKVRNNMRVHLDWRQRLAGNAEPGSGPAVTLAADF